MSRPSKPTTALWRRAQLLLGLLITGLFLALILSRIDIASVANAFGGFALPWLLLALLLLAADYALRILRWWWLLRPLDASLPVTACAWPYLSSIAVNNVLPFRAGDALRAFGFRKQLRAPATRVLGTLVIERLLDMATLLPLFFLGLAAAPNQRFPEAVTAAAAWLAGSLAITLALLLVLTPHLPDLVRRLAGHPAVAARGWSEPLERWGGNFVETFATLRKPAEVLVLLGLSMAIWILEAAVLAAVIGGFDALISPFGALFAMAAGTLSTLIPSAPGYIGTFDFFTLTALTVYDLPEATAAAAAFVLHAVLWVPLTVLGLSYLLFYGRKIWGRGLWQTVRDVKAEAP